MIDIGCKLRKILACILVTAVILALYPSGTLAAEEAVRVFEGREKSAAILANLDYSDVRNSSTWAKPAIWETGALELMKGYGEKRFGLYDHLTVEQAISLAYVMAGREAEAQLAAEALDVARREQDKKIIAPAMWSDGYLQLALNDELITQDQYNDAFAKNQLNLTENDFHRNSSVSREDMAYYIAKVLGINPVNEQTHLFNNFRDWRDANPHRIPYIEALLQNRVMNGDNNGRFSPKGAVTREQAAQIIQNAGPFIFSKLNMEKLKGTVEEITEYTDKSGGKNTLITVVNVRNSGGELHQFIFSKPSAGSATNEMTGNSVGNAAKGTIVNDLGTLRDETSLRTGQEISYIVRNNNVLYVTVIDNRKKIEYKLVKILSADEQNRIIRIEIVADVPFSDIRMLESQSLYNAGSTGKVEALSVSENASIYIDFVQKTIRDIKPEALMLLTLENGLVTSMEEVKMDLLQEEGIVSGILEENNTVLGYVTLFFPDGSGTSPDLATSLSTYRTYSYLRPSDVTVYKNGRTAALDDIKPGDSVFLKLDDNGNIIRISGADNFYPVYGRVRTKGSGTIQLEREDGTIEQLHIPDNTPIYRDRKRISWYDLSEGDNIRVFLQTVGNKMVIGEIIVDRDNREVSGIYKAQLAYYDLFARNLVVSGLQQFNNGIWKQAEPRGITKLPVDEKYNPDILNGIQGTVYIATGMNVLGKDTVIKLAVDEISLQTGIVSDTIVNVQSGRGRMTLQNDNTPVNYDDNSLIVKGGRLLEPNQIKSLDEAYLATSTYQDGSRKANVIWIREPVADTGLALLRGRISQIDLLQTVTLESFSEFKAPDWNFINVQKTLTIDPTITRIFDDGGRLDPANFDDTGSNSFKNRTVYVLAQDGKAILISTAPYGDVVYKGRITKLDGGSRDSFGHMIAPPASLTIGSAMSYNLTTGLWDSKPDTVMDIPVNAVITKNGAVAEAIQLKEGDNVTVIRPAAGTSSCVIIAETY